MMNKSRAVITGIAAAAMLAGTMMVAAPAAQASNAWWIPDHHHHHYYNNNYGYYRDDGGSEVAAGIFGFIAGAFAGSLSHPYYGGNSCYRFKTYNPSTGMYMSYNGPRHCP